MDIRIRHIVTCLVLAFLSYLAVSSSVGLYNLEHAPSQFVSSAYVDGTDMSSLAELGESAVSGATAFVTSVGYGVLIFAASLISSLILTLVFVRKVASHNVAFKATMCIYIAFVALSLLLSLILTRFAEVIPSLIYTGIWALVVGLVYLLPLRLKRR